MRLNKINASALAVLVVSTMNCGTYAFNIPAENRLAESSQFIIDRTTVGELRLAKYIGTDPCLFIPKDIEVVGEKCCESSDSLVRVTCEKGSRLKRIEKGESSLKYSTI